MLPEPQTRRNPPARAGFESRNNIRPAGHANATTDPTTLVLQRLEGVRQAGAGAIAKCPAHPDRTASLSIATGTDGRVLLRCHAGCPALAIVHAIGLELSDLFVRRLGPMTREQQRETSMAARLARRVAALNSIVHEVAVVEVAAGRMVADPDDGLGWDDYCRVVEAHQRIAAARREVAR